MVESSISENAKFEELDRQEFALVMKGTPLSEEEIISRIEGRRVGYGIKTVIPQTDWHNPIKSLNHLLFWNQRSRVRLILDNLSGDTNRSRAVFKSRVRLVLDNLSGPEADRKGSYVITKTLSELLFEGVITNDSSDLQRDLKELENIQPKIDEIEKRDHAPIEIMRLEIRRHELLNKAFFTLTPAGLEYKKLLEPREKLRKEAARNKLCAEIDAREAGRKGLEATS